MVKRRWGVAVGLLCCVIGQGASAARVRSSFDDGWKFRLADQPMAQQAAFDDSAWRLLDLPHDWSIEFDFSQKNSGRNAWLPGGIGWYRKAFTIPAHERGQRFELQFDGVYRHAQVWVNGVLLGMQYDGYTSFSYDITPHLFYGIENTVAVRVDNSVQPNCRWYSGSGIYRHVWLTKSDPLHVVTWGTAVTTPVVTESVAQVRVKTTIENDRIQGVKCVLETVLLDQKGATVASAETEQQIGSGLAFEVDQTLSVFTPGLWSLDMPQLYTAVTRVKVGGQTIDSYKTPFGIRELRFDAEQGFFLNGKKVKMKGVCLHSSAGVVGAAVPERVWERRLKMLKSIGCNAIRTAHNPAAPEFLDMCDRMGFLVMDEFVDKWEHQVRPNADPLNDPAFAEPHFNTEWKNNFRSTIMRDRNHPSVVIWSVGNENHRPGTDKQSEGLERYCTFVRSLDSTRPVVSGMERGLDKAPAEKVDDILHSCAHMDLIALNYGEQWCKRIAHRHPGKAYVSTESYCYFNSTETKRFACVERSPWLDVMENDSNIGLFLWVGIDYLGEKHSQKSWPSIGSSSGVLDLAGFRTERSYLYESFWSDKPMVYLAVYDGDPDDFSTFRNWSWPSMQENWNRAAGTDVNLVSYSNCDSVELYLNGQRLGTQKMSDFSNRIMKWRRIGYQPGTIKAVGLRGGKPVCAFELKTAGNPTRIELIADAQALPLGEVAHVEVRVTDSDGNQVPDAALELDFSTEGAGSVLALNNGSVGCNRSFQEKKTGLTHQGRMLCLLRAANESGKLTLNVSGAGLKGATLNVDVK